MQTFEEQLDLFEGAPMAQLVRLTFEVTEKMTEEDLRDLGMAAAQHLLDTFNDDGSLAPQVRISVNEQGDTLQT